MFSFILDNEAACKLFTNALIDTFEILGIQVDTTLFLYLVVNFGCVVAHIGQKLNERSNELKKRIQKETNMLRND